jgi:hypothetical protein
MLSTSVFSVPPVGLEPTTVGLKDAYLQEFLRKYEPLILVSAGSGRSELLCSGHGSGHASGFDEQLECGPLSAHAEESASLPL